MNHIKLHTDKKWLICKCASVKKGYQEHPRWTVVGTSKNTDNVSY